MKNWKASAIALISLILLPVSARLYACGYVDFTRPYYNLFDPNLMLTAEYSPLFYTTSSYTNDWTEGEYPEKENVAEWVKYLPDKADPASVYEMIYNSTEADLEAAGRGKYTGTNKALQYLAANGYGEILDYLVFAKKCEKYGNIQFYWEEKPADGGQTALINRGKKLLLESQSPFIKLRYAFQTVKLLHLYNRPQECVALFDDFIAPLKTASIIWYWALDHKAGALLKLKRRAEGLYLFSRVFAECPSRRYSSFYSFDVGSQEEWEQCLKYCRNKAEKTTLYFLRAMNPSSVALEEMIQIYRLDPDSAYLRLLIVREINKLENELLSDDLINSYIFIKKAGREYNNKQLLKYIKTLKDFASTVVKQKKVKEQTFWQISEAYLEFLDFDLDGASGKLQGLAVENENYQRQVNIIKTAVAISKLYVVDQAAENEVMSLLLDTYPEDINNREITRYMLDSFDWLFPRQEFAKKYGCHAYLYDLQYYPEPQVIYNLLAIIDKKPHTLFEKYLLLRFDLSPGSEYIFSKEAIRQETDFIFLKQTLLEMKATLLLLADKIEEAYAIYSSLPKDFWNENKANDPFTAGITDPNYESADSRNQISRLDFARRLLELKKKIKNDPQDARSYYLLGNAYYNMTYFGKSWNLASYWRSDAGYTGFTDCSQALTYYKKALAAARDRELKAECCFMLAKCRQNMFDLLYNTNDYGYGGVKWKKYINEDEFAEIEKQKVDNGYREYFKLLRDEYADTDFYQEVVKECKYFAFYISNF